MSQFNKIFISYAKEDFQYAQKVYRYFEELGYDPWLDKEKLLPGCNWDLEIKRALKNSDFIILLLSSISVSKRGYVQREFKLALQHWEQRLEDDIYIIPLLIDQCDVPDMLGKFQWVKFEEAFPAVLHAVERQRNMLADQYNVVDAPESDLKKLKVHEFTDYDVTLITLLSQGILQKNIPAQLQQMNMKPSNLSSVEKRLNLIRESLSVTKNEELVRFCHEMRII